MPIEITRRPPGECLRILYTQPSEPAATLADLVYELLDAHDDTVRLAQDRLCDRDWDAHVDYLRRLHRVGREALSRATH